MNLLISLHEFLELITYNQLFDYVQVPNSIGDAIEICIKAHHIALAKEGSLINSVAPCHIERFAHACVIWYPIGCWANELKRRSNLEAALIEAKKNPVTIRARIIPDDTRHSSLQKQLIEATIKGDASLVAYLLQQIAEGKT